MYSFWKHFRPRPHHSRLLKIYGVIYLGLILVLGSFILGWDLGSKRGELLPQEPGKIVGETAQSPVHLSRDVNFGLYWEVIEAIKNKYVNQPVNEVKLFYGSLAGMVAALEDPYSVFFEPPTAKEFAQELSGEFFGIGAEVGLKNGDLLIIAPLEDSPAERAGLKSNDKILAIDGSPTLGMPLDVAVSKIRGPKGTQVKLNITRAGFMVPRDFSIIRDRIIIKTVKTKFFENNTISYIKISQFNEDTLGDFNKAVTNVLNTGAKKLIIDLRNNPGGFLDSAVNVAGEWLRDDIVVIERFASGEERIYRSTSKGRLSDLETVVIVNGGSASGSEILAGALQDYGKARVLGEKTFGKGSVQDYSVLRDGSALKLTIAEWLTPKKRSINKVGIVPDIEVKPGEEDVNNDKDAQLEKALELLKVN
jgi:carboxyl-terminal processing protease